MTKRRASVAAAALVLLLSACAHGGGEQRSPEAQAQLAEALWGFNESCIAALPDFATIDRKLLGLGLARERPGYYAAQRGGATASVSQREEWCSCLFVHPGKATPLTIELVEAFLRRGEVEVSRELSWAPSDGGMVLWRVDLAEDAWFFASLQERKGRIALGAVTETSCSTETLEGAVAWGAPDASEGAERVRACAPAADLGVETPACAATAIDQGTVLGAMALRGMSDDARDRRPLRRL